MTIKRCARKYIAAAIETNEKLRSPKIRFHDQKNEAHIGFRIQNKSVRNQIKSAKDTEDPWELACTCIRKYTRTLRATGK